MSGFLYICVSWVRPFQRIHLLYKLVLVYALRATGLCETSRETVTVEAVTFPAASADKNSKMEITLSA